MLIKQSQARPHMLTRLTSDLTCMYFFFLQKLSLTSIISDGVVLCVYFAGCRVAAKAKVCPAARAETGKAGPKWCLAGPARWAPPEDTGIETPKLGWSWCYGRPGLGAMGDLVLVLWERTSSIWRCQPRSLEAIQQTEIWFFIKRESPHREKQWLQPFKNYLGWTLTSVRWKYAKG